MAEDYLLLSLTSCVIEVLRGLKKLVRNSCNLGFQLLHD